MNEEAFPIATCQSLVKCAESKTAAKDFKEKRHHRKDYHKIGTKYAIPNSQK